MGEQRPQGAGMPHNGCGRILEKNRNIVRNAELNNPNGEFKSSVTNSQPLPLRVRQTGEAEGPAPGPKWLSEGLGPSGAGGPEPHSGDGAASKPTSQHSSKFGRTVVLQRRLEDIESNGRVACPPKGLGDVPDTGKKFKIH